MRLQGLPRECNVKPKWRNGRRAGLKIRCPHGRVGSSPTFGSNATLQRPIRDKQLRPTACSLVDRSRAAHVNRPRLPGAQSATRARPTWAWTVGADWAVGPFTREEPRTPKANRREGRKCRRLACLRHRPRRGMDVLVRPTPGASPFCHPNGPERWSVVVAGRPALRGVLQGCWTERVVRGALWYTSIPTIRRGRSAALTSGGSAVRPVAADDGPGGWGYGWSC